MARMCAMASIHATAVWHGLDWDKVRALAHPAVALLLKSALVLVVVRHQVKSQKETAVGKVDGKDQIVFPVAAVRGGGCPDRCDLPLNGPFDRRRRLEWEANGSRVARGCQDVRVAFWIPSD
ncbi:hypothetical protein [Stenotrophomonas maltophilia]